ncbi:MAG: S66 peptidase family protein [Patescibacteria group bacterium]
MSLRILPPKLDKNKKIGIIAPADPVRGICPENVIQRGYEYLRMKGFQIEEGKSMKELTQKHTAGSISLRVDDIHHFVKREDVGGIMSFWGGFNTNQLLDHLDYKLIKMHPKIFIGYSDVTALTTAITQKTGLVTFSGPCVISFAKPEPFVYSWNYLNNICITPREKIIIKSSPDYADDLYFIRKDNNHRVNKKNEGIIIFKKGKAKGQIVAGNLQTLLILNGTEYLPDMTGKILFIEEDETSTPAHVDRFLCQGEQIGWFKKISGLVFGRFTEQSQFSPEDSFEELLHRYFSGVQYPVLYNADFGHSDPMITIPNGGTGLLNNDQIVFNKAVSG